MSDVLFKRFLLCGLHIWYGPRKKEMGINSNIT